MNVPPVLVTLETYTTVLQLSDIRLTRFYVPSCLFRCSPLYPRSSTSSGPSVEALAASAVFSGCVPSTFPPLPAYVCHLFKCSVDQRSVCGPHGSLLVQHQNHSCCFLPPPQRRLHNRRYASLLSVSLTCFVLRRFPTLSALPWSPFRLSRFLT